MNFSKLKYLLLLTLTISLFASCGDDDVVVPPEGEVITTVQLTLTPTASSDVVNFTFTDLDGDGGNAPVITSESLAANTTYFGTLTFKNQSVTPEEDITEEIQEEAEEHQIFYATTLDGTTITYNDSDSDNNPIGLSTTFNTGDAGSGTLTITLRHEPNKLATGVMDGDLTNAGGETDIEVQFDFDIQ